MAISDRNRARSFSQFNSPNLNDRKAVRFDTEPKIQKYDLQELFDNVPVFDTPFMNFSSAAKKENSKFLESRLK